MHGSLPGLAAGRFGVIMFFSACRLPSFAPEDPPSHASGNQITTGGPLLALTRRSASPRAWRAGWGAGSTRPVRAPTAAARACAPG